MIEIGKRTEFLFQQAKLCRSYGADQLETFRILKWLDNKFVFKFFTLTNQETKLKALIREAWKDEDRSTENQRKPTGAS